MIKFLRKITSLNNLSRSGGLNLRYGKGQIATLLILVMVVILIFIITTVNIGNLSLQATTLSNAADSGALFLASRLASKGGRLYADLKAMNGDWQDDPPRKESKTYGFFGEFFDYLQHMYDGVRNMGNVSVWTQKVTEAFELFPGAAKDFTGVAVGIAAGPYGWASLAVKAVLNTNAYVDKNRAAGEIAKLLNGLDERSSFREATFLTTSNLAIDDVNTVQDADDSDGDGDKEEQVLQFQYLWYKRVKQLKENLGPMTKKIGEFTGPTGKLTAMRDELAKYCYFDFIYSSSPWGGPMPVGTTTPLLGRQEVEFSDGPAVALFRPLESKGYGLLFYKPGKPTEGYYDDLNEVIAALNNFIQVADDLRDDDAGKIVWNWEHRFAQLYTPKQGSIDAYYRLDKVINGYTADTKEKRTGISSWITEIERIRDSLPDAQYQVCQKEASDTYCWQYLWPDEYVDWKSIGASCKIKRYEDNNGSNPASPGIFRIISRELFTQKGLGGDYNNIIAELEQKGYTYDLRVNPALSAVDDEFKRSFPYGVITLGDILPTISDELRQEVFDRLQGKGYLLDNIAHVSPAFTALDSEFKSWFGWPAGPYDPAPRLTVEQFTQIESALLMAKQKPEYDRILEILRQAPFGSTTTYLKIINSPAKEYYACDDPKFATVDEDTDDEFKPALTVLRNLKNTIESYEVDFQQFYDEMAALTKAGGTEVLAKGRINFESNPFIYTWGDSRCPPEDPLCHTLSISLSDFPIPYVDYSERKSGTFSTTTHHYYLLADYNDTTGDRTQVTVTREDPADKDSGGILGKWNPYANSNGKLSITRRSKTYFSHDKVGLVGK